MIDVFAGSLRRAPVSLVLSARCAPGRGRRCSAVAVLGILIVKFGSAALAIGAALGASASASASRIRRSHLNHFSPTDLNLHLCLIQCNVKVSRPLPMLPFGLPSVAAARARIRIIPTV